MLNPVYLPFADSGVRLADLDSCPRLPWKSAVTGVFRLPGYAKPATCERLLEVAARFPDAPGRMFDRPDARSNRVRVLEFGGETRFAFDLMADLFERANRHFQFELTGLAEPVHTIEYAGGDFIDWHSDCALRETSTRKLVATILLSPPDSFEGGEVEFAAMEPAAEPMAMGDATVFPAFLPHRVHPLRRGRRIVFAAWAHGPAFR